jgi:hypothetical protein
MADKRTTKIGRDAGTGRFIPVDVARRRGKTAVVETMPQPKKRGGKKK